MPSTRVILWIIYQSSKLKSLLIPNSGWLFLKLNITCSCSLNKFSGDIRYWHYKFIKHTLILVALFGELPTFKFIIEGIFGLETDKNKSNQLEHAKISGEMQQTKIKPRKNETVIEQLKYVDDCTDLGDLRKLFWKKCFGQIVD